MCHPTSAAHPGCSGPIGLKLTKILPHCSAPLHRLPVVAQIQFKALVLDYHAANGSGPSYIQKMVKPYTTACPLRSATVKRVASHVYLRTSGQQKPFKASVADWSKFTGQIWTCECKRVTSWVPALHEHRYHLKQWKNRKIIKQFRIHNFKKNKTVFDQITDLFCVYLTGEWLRWY